MNRLLRRIGVLALWSIAPVPLTGHAAGEHAESGWHLDRDRNGIQVYTRKVQDSPFDATRAVMTIKAPIASLVALLRDASACSQWVELCVSSSVLEQIGDSEQYVYTRDHLPWPLSDRDVVSNVKWSRAADTGSLNMAAHATPERIPAKAGVVRLAQADSEWSLAEQPNGEVRVEFKAHADPGGPIPSWLINMMLIDTPYRMLDNMRRLMSEGRYQDSRLPVFPESTTDASP